ncbi:MAG TPA: hypothetical protein VIZ30_07425 [Pseudomonadales bacterium]
MNRPRALGAVSATLLLLALLALSWWGRLDEMASVQTHAALQRALVTFALTRTLNGAISVAQGTELAFEPAGVGVIVSAGEILDPLNDLVEQFSWLALAAATSLGIQIMLGEMFATIPVNAALSVAIVLSIVALWWPAERANRIRATLLRLTATFVFVRFAVVLATLGTGLVNEYFLAPREAASVEFLSRTQVQIESANDTVAPPPVSQDSLLDRFNAFLDDQRRALDVEGRLTRLKQEVESAVEHVVNLIVVYVIETLLLPLGFLVVAWGFVKHAWRRIG